jgi:hypothetical protein
LDANRLAFPVATTVKSLARLVQDEYIAIPSFNRLTLLVDGFLRRLDLIAPGENTLKVSVRDAGPAKSPSALPLNPPGILISALIAFSKTWLVFDRLSFEERRDPSDILPNRIVMMSTTVADLRKLYIRILKDQDQDSSIQVLATRERYEKLQKLKDLNKRTQAVLDSLQTQFQTLLEDNRIVLVNQVKGTHHNDKKEDALEAIQAFDAIFASLPNPAPYPDFGENVNNTNGDKSHSAAQSPAAPADTTSAIDQDGSSAIDTDLHEDVDMEGNDDDDNEVDEVGLGSNIDFF